MIVKQAQSPSRFKVKNGNSEAFGVCVIPAAEKALETLSKWEKSSLTQNIAICLCLLWISRLFCADIPILIFVTGQEFLKYV